MHELANKAEINILSARDTTRAWPSWAKMKGYIKTRYNTWSSSRFKNQLHSLACLIFFVYIMVKCYVGIDVLQPN